MKAAQQSREPTLIGVGLYSVAEAARLLHTNPDTIRRWVGGYHYSRDGERREIAPVWGAPLRVGDTLILTFLDLIEAKLVAALRAHGVSWSTIRRASEIAAQEFGRSHPFAMNRILTDGKRVFTFVGQEPRDERLLDIAGRQLAFDRIVRPFLREVEYEQGIAARWYPGRGRSIVIDPAHSFGRPIVKSVGVPTEVLAGAAKAEDSVELAARWYDVPVAAVRAAVEFEERLAA